MAVGASMAQTQNGLVKTRGRMVNGQLLPGVGIPMAIVQVQGRSALMSLDDGTFAFPLRTKTFLLQSVKKTGYQLVDMEACRTYEYSSNQLCLTMENPAQQLEEKLSKEKQWRRRLQKQLEELEDSIDQLNISLEKKNQLQEDINHQRSDNEKIISELAAYYSSLDYDLLNDFQKQVSLFLENGDFHKADSMLRSRGKMEERISEIEAERAAEAKQEEELNISKAGTQKKTENAAADCANFHIRFLQTHQNDSASYYLELRARLDTTNISWQNDAGRFLCEYVADYPKALSYFRRGLALNVAQYGEKGERTATSYNYLGVVNEYQGNLDQALAYYQKALATKEQALGQNNASVAVYYNNIGNVYLAKRDYGRALECHQKALDIRMQLLGAEHPDVSGSYNNIGGVYRLHRDYAHALEYYQKALSIREKSLGVDHPSTATTYNNIGLTYQLQGDLSQAITYHKKALGVREDVLGMKHPHTATSYNNIGSLYYQQKNLPLALEYLLKALNIREKVLGTQHLTTATSYNNVASVYRDQGDIAQALDYYQKALKAYESKQGPEGPDVMKVKEKIQKLQ